MKFSNLIDDLRSRGLLKLTFWAVAEAVAVDRKTSATVAIAKAEDRRFEKVYNKEVGNTYRFLRTL